MARHEANRAAACYHAFVAILLLLMGGAMLGFGIWLQVTNKGGLVDLQYQGESFANVVLGAAKISIIIGVVFILTSVVSLIALARKCVGKVFRVIYILLALVILAALIIVSTVCFLIVANREADFFKNILEDAWKKAVVEKPKAICVIERQLNCRGFNDSKCVQEQCAQCDAIPGALQSGLESCYQAVKGDLRRVYLPLAIVSAVVGLIVLIDIFVVCAL